MLITETLCLYLHITNSKTNLKAMKNIKNIEINRTSSYGRYIIKGDVNGVEVTATTTDSEAFDYLNDKDYPEKQSEAIIHCMVKLEDSFKNI